MAYPGGKAGAGVYQQIINQIPPHRVYIEPFLGNGSIMRRKRPAEINIGIDLDEIVISNWENAPGFIAINCDAISFLSSYKFQGDEFVYADPPYLFSTRASSRNIYKHEMGEEHEHVSLLTTLKSLPCNVAISGYHSQLYADMLANWRSINFQAQTRSGRSATEWVWFNYKEPTELHDYRYLGSTFRERERFSRIRKNMLAKLARMDRLERYAILASIEDYKSCSTA